jgi:hypothetical protein
MVAKTVDKLGFVLMKMKKQENRESEEVDFANRMGAAVVDSSGNGAERSALNVDRANGDTENEVDTRMS